MAGVFGYGTVFSVTVGSVLKPIANLTNIGGLDLTADEIDVTDHDSEDGFREFISGLKDGGSVSLEGNFTDDASQKDLLNLLVSGTVVPMTIAFPDGLATWSFEGFVSGFGTEGPLDDKIPFTASVKVSGKPTLS